jgi:glutaconyl-CoA/methylmalonyl-CoA decarboxylase subunit gamma
LATHKFAINDKEYEVEVGSRQGGRVQVTVNGTLYDVELKTAAVAAPARRASVPPPVMAVPAAAAAPAAGGGDSAVLAPMAGLVLSVKVKVGDQVAAGDELLVLEAMKMENAITAHRSGTVKRVAVDAQQVVNQDDVLVEIA